MTITGVFVSSNFHDMGKVMSIVLGWIKMTFWEREKDVQLAFSKRQLQLEIRVKIFPSLAGIFWTDTFFLLFKIKPLKKIPPKKDTYKVKTAFRQL